MDVLELMVHIDESPSYAATAKMQAVYTSSDSEAERMTPKPTKKK
jgi:hypothetical protein